ncbi:MAG: OmpA family protein [Magnetospirillum sp.]|nr:OmpA family protein [Magnetospirillum sp.]
MHSQESAEPQSNTTTTLAQSMGGIYLLVTVLLLFIIALLSLGGVAYRTHLLQQSVTSAAPPKPKPPVVVQPDLVTGKERAGLYARLARLGEELALEASERNRLADRLDKLLALQIELAARPTPGAEFKAEPKDGDARAALLRNMEEIERELASVSQALEATEQRISSRQVDVAGLGNRLNRALVLKVEELQKGRSEFFARLRDVLGDREDFRVEGDRFSLPSEVLFAPGSDRLRPQGLDEVRRLAAKINGVKAEFPQGLNWVLRVSGHTDARPIANTRFPSNWELSTLRAVTVVKELIAAGIPPEHVAAAGFGEFQPLVVDETEAAYARNRRIEFRLDQR